MATEHLLVVLQSHSKSNALPDAKEQLRYPDVPKVEVSKRCILSLVNSLNYAQYKNPNLEIHLQVFDDNSSEDFLVVLEKILRLSHFNVTFTQLGGIGIMKSILTCYEYARDYGQKHVYFVQDDFLHHETAIHYMYENYKNFAEKVGKDITLTGNHDMRYLMYSDNISIGCKVVPGIDQCWRTTHASQFTTMTKVSLVKDNWDLFEKFGNISYDDECCEDKSINHLYFYRGYVEFCPINSLVLQIQWDIHKDFYITWEEWWKKYELSKFKIVSN
jgi:hypothetical protein